MSFESSLDRLETILGELEHDELELDRALLLFEEGVERLREANAALLRAEARIRQLRENADGTFELVDLGD